LQRSARLSAQSASRGVPRVGRRTIHRRD
jgi:hypothetical protein